jgi:hypothetical protein
MNAYESLQRYLQTQDGEHVTLSFAQLADILGRTLPKVAQHATWWANDPDHPEARAWLEAGYQVAFVSLESQSVTFIRVFVAAC